MATEAACSGDFLRENVSLSIAERAELLNSIDPKVKMKTYLISKAYRKAGIRKKKVNIVKYFPPHLFEKHLEMERIAAESLYKHLRIDRRIVFMDQL